MHYPVCGSSASLGLFLRHHWAVEREMYWVRIPKLGKTFDFQELGWCSKTSLCFWQEKGVCWGEYPRTWNQHHTVNILWQEIYVFHEEVKSGVLEKTCVKIIYFRKDNLKKTEVSYLRNLSPTDSFVWVWLWFAFCPFFTFYSVGDSVPWHICGTGQGTIFE